MVIIKYEYIKIEIIIYTNESNIGEHEKNIFTLLFTKLFSIKFTVLILFLF